MGRCEGVTPPHTPECGWNVAKHPPGHTGCTQVTQVTQVHTRGKSTFRVCRGGVFRLRGLAVGILRFVAGAYRRVQTLRDRLRRRVALCDRLPY